MEPAVQRAAVDPPPAPPVAPIGGQAFRHSHLCVCHTGSAGKKIQIQIKKLISIHLGISSSCSPPSSPL